MSDSKNFMDTMKVLNNVVLFDVVVSGSSGSRTFLTDETIRHVGKTLPNGCMSEVAKFRAQCVRALLKKGVARKVESRVRGYFVPLDHAKDVAEELTKLKDNFDDWKVGFIQSLPEIITNWANTPENMGTMLGSKTISEYILEYAPTVSEVEKSLSFEMSAIQLGTTQFFAEEDAVHKEVRGIPAQAANEIAFDVTSAWKGSSDVTGSTLRIIKRIMLKAKAMGSLDDRFNHFAAACRMVLDKMPTKGDKIDGLNALMVTGLLAKSMDPASILNDVYQEFDPSFLLPKQDLNIFCDDALVSVDTNPMPHKQIVTCVELNATDDVIKQQVATHLIQPTPVDDFAFNGF